ncbi:MAG: hypothetical protein QOH60_1762 [Mycobacterium sp.]|jgi:hypothetical protein|nr:hypothetical protein [Mycobacterium sp.]
MRNHRHGSALDGHADLHSELGPNRGEHSGRATNPTIKVTDLAWLEFEKPDLARAETFARAFGFAVAAREPDARYLRGSLPGTPAVIVRKGVRSRFIGPCHDTHGGPGRQLQHREPDDNLLKVNHQPVY